MPDFAPSTTRDFAVFFATDGSANGLYGAALESASEVDATDKSSSDRTTQTPMTDLQTPQATDIATDDFVDFYALLKQPADASTTQLRSRINEMYAEAQANRDHRNAERRRQYATLLFWIPQARHILLHEGKRAKYDAYATRVQNGGPSENFRAFLDGLIDEMDALNSGEGLLGLRDATTERAPDARLSPRLDAVRAAAGEAVRASSVAPNTVSAASPFVTVSPETVAPNSVPSAFISSAAALPVRETTQIASSSFAVTETSDATEPRAGTANTLREDSAPETSNAARERKRSAPRYEISPTLQRERAILFSSAAGGVALLLVLLASRVALPNISLAILCGVALVAGFFVWRVARRQMLRGFKAKKAN